MAALEKIGRKKGVGAPLFILSFRRRDELMQAAEKGGWLPIAARRSKGAETRFLASGASIIVVDAREAVDEARQGIRALAEAAVMLRNRGGNLVPLHPQPSWSGC